MHPVYLDSLHPLTTLPLHTTTHSCKPARATPAPFYFLTKANHLTDITSSSRSIMPTLTVPPEYGYVLIVQGLLVMLSLYLGASVMKYRRQYFGQEFQNANKDLLEQHKKDFPHSPFSLGYPDMGSGRYTDKLDYASWYTFNNAQRGHHNFLEQVWGVSGLMLVGGLFAPSIYAGLGAVYFFARLIYAIGYSSSKGPKGREAGAILAALTTLGMVGYAMKIGYGLVQEGK